MILAPVLGLAVGFLHVLTGPDHLAAIAPLAASERRGAWRIGVRWGLGHSLGVVALGLVAALLGQRLALDPTSAGDALSAGGERAVGAWAIFRDTLIEQAEQGVDYFTVGNEIDRQDTIGGACSKESNTLRYGLDRVGARCLRVPCFHRCCSLAP